MRILKTFYVSLWSKSPIWILILSALFLIELLSHMRNPQIALLGGFFLIFILFFTNVTFSAICKIRFFYRIQNNKVKTLFKILKILLYFVVAALLTILLELLLQLILYPIFIKIGPFSKFYPVGCLVLSNFGSTPMNKSFRDTAFYSFEVGFSFTTFLFLIGLINYLVWIYIQRSIIPQIIAISALLIVMIFSKIGANQPALQGFGPKNGPHP